MYAVACRTVTVSQSLFAARFANWHFSLPNKLNLAFKRFKGHGVVQFSSLQFSCGDVNMP